MSTLDQMQTQLPSTYEIDTEEAVETTLTVIEKSPEMNTLQDFLNLDNDANYLELDLSSKNFVNNKNISQILGKLTQISQLTNVYLSNNHSLTTLPEDFTDDNNSRISGRGNLTMDVLDLSGTGLTTLPENFYNIQSETTIKDLEYINLPDSIDPDTKSKISNKNFLFTVNYIADTSDIN